LSGCESHTIYAFLLFVLVKGADSMLSPLTYPGAAIQAMFGIGRKFSMFLSDTPVDGYMLDIIQDKSRKFASIELPDCRYVGVSSYITSSVCYY